MIRWISYMGIALLAIIVNAAACSSSPTNVSRIKADASDAADGSRCIFGCSLAPCGRPCTDPCGCCPNDNCMNDAQADADGGPLGDISTHENDGGSCGLALSWNADSATCQGWADQNCCLQERACANQLTCSTLVKCVNACPVPRKDACINACGAPPTSFADFGTCSRQAPPAPAQCEWP